MSEDRKRDNRFRTVEKLLYIHHDCEKTRYPQLDKAIDRIRDDKYYPIIEMRYFRKMKMDEIIEKLPYSRKTVYDKRNKLIDRIIDVMYADDIMKEIMETKKMHKVLHLFFTETYRRYIKAVTEAIRKGNKKYTKQVTGWWIVKKRSTFYNCTYKGVVGCSIITTGSGRRSRSISCVWISIKIGWLRCMAVQKKQRPYTISIRQKNIRNMHGVTGT